MGGRESVRGESRETNGGDDDDDDDDDDAHTT